MKRIQIYLLVFVVSIFCAGCAHDGSQKHEPDIARLAVWEGCYEYYEFYEPNINMVYHIDIYQKDAVYYADVRAIGYMTDEYLLCTVVGDENRIDIIFAELVQEDMYNRFKPGDVLLSFQRNDTGLETEWIALTPIQLHENDNNYFEQVPTGENTLEAYGDLSLHTVDRT